MDQISKLFSSMAYGLAATIFYKKSFRKDEIPVVSSLVLLGVVADSLRTKIFTDLSVGAGHISDEFNSIYIFAGTSAVIIWALYLSYCHQHLILKTIWSSVFVAYLFAILDVRGSLATNIWASTSHLKPEHFAPSWNVYRVLISAGIQFVRKPKDLKTKLQGMRAKFGPIYIMTLTHYMFYALTVDRSMLVVLMSGMTVVIASVAGIILRPDNAAVLETLGVTTTHPQRRWYHGRMMASSLFLFGVISAMEHSKISLCILKKVCS